MRVKLRSIIILAVLVLLVYFSNRIFIPVEIVTKFPQLVMVFLSVVIQALPFVLLGVFGSALLQQFVTVEMVEARLVKMKRIPGILMAVGAGFFFPVCDCGIIPVVRRMILKKVPPYMAVAFLLTAPLVNPITLWATATAFNYNLTVTLLRVLMAIVVGIVVALVVSYYFPRREDLLLDEIIAGDESIQSRVETAASSEIATTPKKQLIWGELIAHANQEFLEVVKYLIVGALIAAMMQVLIPKEVMLVFAEQPFLSVVAMMVLAVCLSLCAEADAFVARSFTYHFPLGSVMGFMVFGQMIDLKNGVLLLKNFKLKPLAVIFGIAAWLVVVFAYLLNLLAAKQLIWGW